MGFHDGATSLTLLVGLADWESVETQNTYIEEAADAGIFAPLIDRWPRRSA